MDTTTTTAVIQHPVNPPHLFLGETYGFWCQTVVLLGATIFAYVAIRNSRAIEKKKAASSALFESNRDTKLKDAIKLITQLHDGDQNIGKYAKKENHETPESKSIKYALNHYEYISVGIAEQIFDEGVFKSAVYTTVTNLYNRTLPFINEARKVTGTKTTFQEFECLACKWIALPLEHKPVRSMPEKQKWRKKIAQMIAGEP